MKTQDDQLQAQCNPAAHTLAVGPHGSNSGLTFSMSRSLQTDTHCSRVSFPSRSCQQAPLDQVPWPWEWNVLVCRDQSHRTTPVAGRGTLPRLHGWGSPRKPGAVTCRRGPSLRGLSRVPWSCHAAMWVYKFFLQQRWLPPASAHETHQSLSSGSKENDTRTRLCRRVEARVPLTSLH